MFHQHPSSLCQNSELAEHFFLFLMSCTCKDLGSVLLLCLSIFFPNTEFIALEPILTPNFAKSPTIPLPVWLIPCNFLYFFFILFALSWVGVFAKANLTFFFLVRFFLGPVVRAFVTLMLPGKFFLLILSYLQPWTKYLVQSREIQ